MTDNNEKQKSPYRDLLKTGKRIKYNAESLRKKGVEFLDFCVNNPIKQPHRDFINKKTVYTEIARPLTQQAFCVFAGITRMTFNNYVNGVNQQQDPSNADLEATKDLQEVAQILESIFFSHNFNHAAVGVYKENLIARQLGLGENQTLKGDKERPLETIVGINVIKNG